MIISLRDKFLILIINVVVEINNIKNIACLKYKGLCVSVKSITEIIRHIIKSVSKLEKYILTVEKGRFSISLRKFIVTLSILFVIHTIKEDKISILLNAKIANPRGIRIVTTGITTIFVIQK